jgi:CBS domain-containing membrane protein
MSESESKRTLQRQDFERALQSMDTFIDVEVDDLMTLAQRAQHFAEQRLSEALLVANIMSHPVATVSEHASMAEAAHLIVTERISGLPVVDAEQRLVGIVTEADFLRGLGVPAHQPSHNLWQTLETLFAHLGHNGELESPNDPVSRHMARNVVCTTPQADLDQVLALMKQHHIKRLPVCDDTRHVVGMVTRSDMVRIFFDRYLQKPAEG